MAQALEFFFDSEADREIRSLWQRLEQAGIPSLATRTHGQHRPHVSFAIAGSIPPAIREALRTDLARLSIPRLWLSTLGAFSSADTVLMLAAVVDTELLAVHSAIHDVLAGHVRAPSAYYLPGSWIPHCTLTQGIDPPQIAAAFATLYPVNPIRATLTEAAIIDTHTGASDPVLTFT